MKASRIEWFSFLLLRDLPSEFNSMLWRSGIADMRKQFGEEQSLRTACQGYVYSVAVDFEEESASEVACPTAYCRIRPDQRWQLAVVPYCVPMNTTKYLGVECRVLRVIKASKGIDRETLAGEYKSIAEQHNNRVLRHAYPFNVHRIAGDYALACGAVFGHVYGKSDRPQAGDELWSDLHEIRETKPFPLEIDEGAVEWQEDYDLATRTGERPPIGWPLPEGLVSSFYSERSYCYHEDEVGHGTDAAYDSLKHNDPGWAKRNEEAIYETLMSGTKNQFVNALFVKRRPYLSDRATFGRTFVSGHVIYKPYPFGQKHTVHVLSIGVNRDERRQGYASQMLRMLARHYPDCTIHLEFDHNNVECLALMIGMGAGITKENSQYLCAFNLSSLFPLESQERNPMKNPTKKKRKK